MGNHLTSSNGVNPDTHGKRDVADQGGKDSRELHNEKYNIDNITKGLTFSHGRCSKLCNMSFELCSKRNFASKLVHGAIVDEYEMRMVRV